MSKFQVTAFWADAKVIFLEPNGFYKIENKFACALGVEATEGDQFFLCQKITTQDGREYTLHRYDFEKQVLYYKRRER